MSGESIKAILEELSKIQGTLGGHTADLKAIKIQTTKTNGTVRDLVQWRSNVQAVNVDREKRQAPITTNFWDSPAFMTMLKIGGALASAVLLLLGAKAI